MKQREKFNLHLQNRFKMLRATGIDDENGTDVMTKIK